MMSLLRLLCIVLLSILSTLVVPLVAAQELESATSSAGEVSEYTLPYPGLLPDNPLYPFKVFRDRLVYFLISDPAKKAEFAILQADKGLSSGLYLLQRKNKDETLALATIAKGEKYFPDALKSITEAKKQGIDVLTISKKLVNSIDEHQILLLEIEEMATPKFVEQITVIRKDSASYQKEAIKLVPNTSD